MEFAIRHKLDGRDAETGAFNSEAEALRWWSNWGREHPGDKIREWALVERETGKVIASHDAGEAL
ncbi:MAG: hypothetical protein ACRCYU_01970 [Nocardioides sp.]